MILKLYHMSQIKTIFGIRQAINVADIVTSPSVYCTYIHTYIQGSSILVNTMLSAIYTVFGEHAMELCLLNT